MDLSNLARLSFEPPPLSPEELRRRQLFGQFIGPWEFDAVRHAADGSRVALQGEWCFGWILEGRAIQDVWMTPTARQRAEGAPLTGLGTAVRYYDPARELWRVSWTGVVDGFCAGLTARAEREEIVLSGLDAERRPMRWIFSEIARTAFNWRRVFSPDDGRSWVPVLEMRVRRRRIDGRLLPARSMLRQ